jgi:hypothetical protein
MNTSKERECRQPGTTKMYEAKCLKGVNENANHEYSHVNYDLIYAGVELLYLMDGSVE